MGTHDLFADVEHKNRVRQSSQASAPVKAPGGTAGMLAHLQRSAGNAAVSSLLRQYTVQREADDEELQMKRDTAAATLQREGVDDEEELQMKRDDGALQREGDDEEELQMKRAGDGVHGPVGLEGGPLHSSIAERIQARRGSGSPLDSGVRTTMEKALNTDFSRVNVHTDSEADALNRSVSAVAFTTGHDIFFKQGAYNPGSGGGQQLLAHELTHVVQQSQGAVGGGGGGMHVGPAGDSHEQQADATAAAVVARAVDNDIPELG
ncbi:MAG: DUF4157 domain-containing protein [Chloroflexota bacterium]|nr:DUF4157 domain-containing protein [Chloroflexota bacterium]